MNHICKNTATIVVLSHVNCRFCTRFVSFHYASLHNLIIIKIYNHGKRIHLFKFPGQNRRSL